MRLSTTKTLIGSLCGAAMLSAGLVSCAPKHNTLSEAEIADGWQAPFRRQNASTSGRTSTATR